MGTKYVVQGSNASTVTIRPIGIFGAFSAVSIPRASVASVRYTLGYLHVETTGGKVYSVVAGARDSVRVKTDAAFPGIPGLMKTLKTPAQPKTWQQEQAHLRATGQDALADQRRAEREKR